MVLVKEKRRLRRQYSQNKDPAVKTRINQLQKQVKDELRVETQARWEKFCNSVCLETHPRVVTQNQELPRAKWSVRLSNTAPRRRSRQDKC